MLLPLDEITVGSSVVLRREDGKSIATAEVRELVTYRGVTWASCLEDTTSTRFSVPIDRLRPLEF